MIRKTTLAAAVAALLLPAAGLLLPAAGLLLPAAAWAQTTTVLTPVPTKDADKKPGNVLSHLPKDIVDCQPHDQAREAADTKLGEQAWNMLGKHDIAGLRGLKAKLEDAASHAPDKPSFPEKCDGTLYIYSDDITDTLAASGLIADKALGIKSVVQRLPLPYAHIDFVLGWMSVEGGQLAQADEWFVRGLRNSPHDALLASEHANALSQLGRNQEALAFVDGFLADNDGLPDTVHALMLRRKGYALGELGRHDEAIAAYEESLKYDPDSSVAKNELTWNKSQKGK
jgi:tetratricopeptide (TPR) repeat protein